MTISPTPVAKFSKPDPLPILQQLAAQIPWFRHVILMEKVKDQLLSHYRR
jgi:hypothetical protein